MVEYDYDVALSFLAEDEAVAMHLADTIGERCAVFLQPARERERLASDDVDASASVFAERARLCVVLYREPWGDRDLTAAEAAAMKARGLEHGWDFLLVVALDPASGSRAPVWAPRGNVWMDYERHGVAGAAAVIEHKVRELGGEPVSESVQQRGERLQRAAAAALERDAFLESEAGVEAAQGELARMFAAFKAETDGLRWSKSPPDIYAECRQRQCAVRTSRAGLSIQWQLSFGNTLHLSGLRVRVYDRPVYLDGQYRGGEKDPVAEEEFAFTRLLDGRFGWVSRADQRRVWTTEQFVQQLLKTLLDRTHAPGRRADMAEEPERRPMQRERGGSGAESGDRGRF